MDPLQLLKEYINQGKDIVHDPTTKKLIFGPHQFEDSLPVEIQLQGTVKRYTLGALWFFGITFVGSKGEREKDQGWYMREGSARHLPLVSLLDRKNLQTWFQQGTEQKAESLERPAKRAKIDGTGTESKDEEKAVTPAGMDLFAAETGLSSEKIASLKQKRQSMKKSDALDEELGESQRSLKELAAREIPLKTPVSILQSPTRKEFDSIFQTVQKMIANEKREKQEKEKEIARKARAAAAATHKRYETNEEDFLKATKHSAAVEFAIDTHGSFVSSGPRVVPRPVSRPEPEKTPKRSRSESDPSKHRRKSENPSQFTPIIIVPGSSNPDVLLSLYNIEEFVCKSTYQPPTQAKASKGPISGNRTKISHTKKNGQTIDFIVVDNALKLESKEWEHVVAVFVQGQEWQFKGWKWPLPATIFSKVLGFYMMFEDDNVPNTVTNWNVSLLQVNKHKRHLDHPAAMKFWEAVDLELGKRKWVAPVATKK